MTFLRPWLLAFAPILALLVGALALAVRRRRVSGAETWSAGLGARARAEARGAPLVLAGCALLAGIALAGPRGGPRTVRAETRSLNLVLAVDVSRSMLAEDVAPSRLQRATREARRLVEDLPGDRVGLIAFAWRSYILSPLTTDGSSVRMFLDAMDPDLVSQQGTSLATVLRQGVELLAATQDGSDRVLVVFTDGESHDSLAEGETAARRLRDAGVRLILVAEGTGEAVRIPLREAGGKLVEYKLDDKGDVVRTRRRDDILRRIADAAEGSVVASELPDQAGAVREVVSTLRRASASETRAADLEPLEWIPALAAGVLLLTQTWFRGGAALAGLLLALSASTALAQRPARGSRALAEGRLLDAAREFARGARGAAADTALFNAGTAALQAGEMEEAKGALGQAARSVDPDIRYRALYNLGLIALQQARADTAGREARLREASDRLREALLLEPRSVRAKWNLELAQRLKPPPSGGGGGGGGSKSPTPASPPPRAAEGAVSQSQADQILTSMEREELATQQARQRRTGSAPRGIKDW